MANEDKNETSRRLTKASLKDASTLVCASMAQTFDEFSPLISTFFTLGEEMIVLYEKAKHNKDLCSFLLKRCNCAEAAVRDLNIRKTENEEFFSKKENLILFKGFIGCMKKIKNFIRDVSQLNKLKKYFFANRIDEDFAEIVKEFDGYMNSLNFSFALQSRNELSTVKCDMKKVKDLLYCVYGVSDDKQSQRQFFEKMDLITEKNKAFQKQNKQNKSFGSSEFKALEENEPLLDGNQYYKTSICPSKKIEKRTAKNNCDEFCFKEFSNNSHNPPASLDQSNNEETQIEIRKQVNILKELKNSDHIIRFFGVSQEDSKYYLVTEWMENGNLHEYYTKFRDNINLETKIKFALDICRGVAYLHECKILHHDIQSANILVNGNRKVKIANFGLSKKFSDITRNILHNLENIRYLAPEKLLLDNDENNNNDTKRKKVPYDSKCEIYSVGALLWEIAELKKPHSDLDKSEMLVGIRKRVSEKKYRLPFSSDVPVEWKAIVTRAMEYEPTWRRNMSDICRDFYNLNKEYSDTNSFISEISTNDNYISVDDAIKEHRSKDGNKESAWQSFKHHSSTNIEAKYWMGYYYYHDEKIPELLQIDKEERIKIAAKIFKETADKGNPSAQLRYGMCLWQGEGVDVNSLEALKYLKLAAKSENSAAMYIIGKAYWNGGNGIDQDKNQGAKYLKSAAECGHPKAIEMCKTNESN